MIKRRLGIEIDAGCGLLADGHLVEGEPQFRRWYVAAFVWRERTSNILRESFAKEAADEFRSRTMASGSPVSMWRQHLPAHLRRIEEMVELLNALRGSLSRQAGAR